MTQPTIKRDPAHAVYHFTGLNGKTMTISDVDLLGKPTKPGVYLTHDNGAPGNNVLNLSVVGKLGVVIERIVTFDPTKHPHGWHGRFIDTPNRPALKDTTPGSVILAKHAQPDGGGIEVSGYQVIKHSPGATQVHPVDLATGEVAKSTSHLEDHYHPEVAAIVPQPPLGSEIAVKDALVNTYLQRKSDGKRFMVAKKKPGASPGLPVDIANTGIQAIMGGYGPNPPDEIELPQGYYVEVATPFPNEQHYVLFHEDEYTTDSSGDPEPTVLGSGNADDIAARIQERWVAENGGQKGWVMLYPVDVNGAPEGGHLVLPDTVEGQFIASAPSVATTVTEETKQAIQHPGEPTAPPDKWPWVIDQLKIDGPGHKFDDHPAWTDVVSEWESWAATYEHLSFDKYDHFSQQWDERYHKYLKERLAWLHNQPGEVDPAEIARLQTAVWLGHPSGSVGPYQDAYIKDFMDATAHAKTTVDINEGIQQALPHLDEHWKDKASTEIDNGFTEGLLHNQKVGGGKPEDPGTLIDAYYKVLEPYFGKGTEGFAQEIKDDLASYLEDPEGDVEPFVSEGSLNYWVHNQLSGQSIPPLTGDQFLELWGKVHDAGAQHEAAVNAHADAMQNWEAHQLQAGVSEPPDALIKKAEEQAIIEVFNNNLDMIDMPAGAKEGINLEPGDPFIGHILDGVQAQDDASMQAALGWLANWNISEENGIVFMVEATDAVKAAQEQVYADWKQMTKGDGPPKAPNFQEYADATWQWLLKNDAAMTLEKHDEAGLKKLYDKHVADLAVNVDNTEINDAYDMPIIAVRALDAADLALVDYGHENGLTDMAVEDAASQLESLLRSKFQAYQQAKTLYDDANSGGILADMPNLPPGLPDPPKKYAPGVGKNTIVVIESVQGMGDPSPGASADVRYVVKRVNADDPGAAGDSLGSFGSEQEAKTAASQTRALHENIIKRTVTSDIAKQHKQYPPKVGDHYVTLDNRVFRVEEVSTFGEQGKTKGDLVNQPNEPVTKIVWIGSKYDQNQLWFDSYLRMVKLDSNDDAIIEHATPATAKSASQVGYAPKGSFEQLVIQKGLTKIATDTISQGDSETYVPELRSEWDMSELSGQDHGVAIDRLKKLGFGETTESVGAPYGEGRAMVNRYGVRIQMALDDQGRVTDINSMRPQYETGTKTSQEFHDQLTEVLTQVQSGEIPLRDLVALDPSHDLNLEARQAHTRQILYDLAARRARGKDGPPDLPEVKSDKAYADEIALEHGGHSALLQTWIDRTDKPDAQLSIPTSTASNPRSSAWVNEYLIGAYADRKLNVEGMDDNVAAAFGLIVGDQNPSGYELYKAMATGEYDTGGEIVETPLLTVGDWFGSVDQPQTVRQADQLPEGAIFELGNGKQFRVVSPGDYAPVTGTTETPVLDTTMPDRFALRHSNAMEAARFFVDEWGKDNHGRFDEFGPEGQTAIDDGLNVWTDEVQGAREHSVRSQHEQADSAMRDWIKNETQSRRATEGTIAELPYMPEFDIPNWGEIDLVEQTSADIGTRIANMDERVDMPVFFTGGLVEDGIVQMGKRGQYGRVPKELDQVAAARLLAAGAEQTENSQDLNTNFSYSGSGEIYAGHMLRLNDPVAFDTTDTRSRYIQEAGDFLAQRSDLEALMRDNVEVTAAKHDNLDDIINVVEKLAQQTLGGPDSEAFQEFKKRTDGIANGQRVRTIEYVEHQQAGDLAPNSSGLTTGAPTSQRGQIRMYGYTPEEAVTKMQELGLVHDLEPQVPFRVIMRGGRRTGRVRILHSDYLSGKADPPEIKHSITHGITGEGDLDSILRTGALMSISERVRLGILDNASTSKKGDVRSGIDTGIFATIGKSGWGPTLIYYRDSAFLDRNVFISEKDYGASDSRYDSYTRWSNKMREQAGQEAGRIYDPLSPKARAIHIDEVSGQGSNEWNVQHAIPIDDWEYLVIANSTERTRVREILARKLRSGEISRAPAVVSAMPVLKQQQRTHENQLTVEDHKAEMERLLNAPEIPAAPSVQIPVGEPQTPTLDAKQVHDAIYDTTEAAIQEHPITAPSPPTISPSTLMNMSATDIENALQAPGQKPSQVLMLMNELLSRGGFEIPGDWFVTLAEQGNYDVTQIQNMSPQEIIEAYHEIKGNPY